MKACPDQVALNSYSPGDRGGFLALEITNAGVFVENHNSRMNLHSISAIAGSWSAGMCGFHFLSELSILDAILATANRWEGAMLADPSEAKRACR